MLGDLTAVARALLAAPAGLREARLVEVFDAADAAGRHFRRTGRCHPQWGDGSLMAAALAGPVVPEPPLSNADYCRSLIRVFEAVEAYFGQAEAQSTQRAAVGSSARRASGIRSPQSSQ